MFYTAPYSPQGMVTDMSKHSLSAKQIGAAAGTSLAEHPIAPPSGLTKLQKDWWIISSQPVPAKVGIAIGNAILDIASEYANRPNGHNHHHSQKTCDND